MDVLIIHYNTPELTEAAVRSLWKHTPKARVTIFDNSDKRPFDASRFTLHDIRFTYIDNTRGQVVNWEEWLALFPNKEPALENDWGSAKHCYSVEMCYDRFPNGFVLMDSDVLVKKDITPMCDETKAFVGRIHCNTRNFGFHINRLCPYLCWINTPLLKPYRVRYFHPDKMWKLHRWKQGDTSKGCHDTGAWFLDQALRTGLPYEDMEIMDYIVHFKAASWRKPGGHVEWLRKHQELWK